MEHIQEHKRSPFGGRPKMSDLRIVLLGTSMSENSRVRNLIFNKCVFVKKTQSSGVEEFSESVEGRNFTVISTDLLKSELKLQTATEKALELFQFYPHVIILVLQHNYFNQHQRDLLPSVLIYFGEQPMKRTMILTTDDKIHSSKQQSGKENKFIQQLSTECGGGRCQLQNTQRSQILQNVDEIITRSGYQKTPLDQEDKCKREHSPTGNRPNMSDLRIVLLGTRIAENYRVVNLILNKKVFVKKELLSDVEEFSERVEGRNITVISTYQLLNLELNLFRITQKAFKMSSPEPQAIILVLQHRHFSKKQRDRLSSVLNCFGEQAMKRTMILTTDDVSCETGPKSVQEIEFIKKISAECGGGRLQLQYTQRSQILKNIDKMIIPQQSSSVGKEDSGATDSDDKQLVKLDKGHISGKQSLNLVLCGSDGSLTVSVSELLRGIKRYTSHQRVSSKECVKKEEKIHGRQITLLELPALSRLSEDEVMRQTLRCVSLCDPGVHAFLLIIHVGPLNNEDKAEIEKILKKFDSQQHFIIIFVSDGTVKGPMANFIQSSSECQDLISCCGGLYCVMGLKEHENSRQIPELLDYIEKMKTEPYSLQMFVKAQESRARREAEEKYEEQLKRMEKQVDERKRKGKVKELQENDVTNDDLRIVLLGKTGNGKSASGNTILRRPAFKSVLTPRSVTRESQKYQGEISRRRITVIDTPGLFDTGVDNDEIMKEIVKCISMAAPGPHVFLLVIQLGRFTKEEKDAVKMIQEMFGDQSRMYTIVLFTKGDQLKEEQTIEDFIEDDDSLTMLVHQCEERYHVFNNETEDQTQVSELLDKIDCMVVKNRGTFYTNEMFQQNIREEQERIMKEKEEEIKRKEEELKDKYEAEIEQMKNKNERERKEMQDELRKSKEEFKKKEEEIKKEKDESLQKELRRKLEEQQKQFEKENRRKEKALGEQQDKFLKFLEEQHKKDKQELKERIQKETREQAEREFCKRAEEKLAYRAKYARDWGAYVPVLGAPVGEHFAAFQDIYAQLFGR